MKKVFKKIAGMMIVATLSFSAVACGSSSSKTSSSNESAEDLLTKVVDASKDLKSIAMSGDFDIEMEMTAQGASADMSMNGDIEGKATTDPQVSYTKFNMSYSILGQNQTMSTEEYSVVNDNLSEVYVNDGTGWVYKSQDMSEYSDLIDSIKELSENFDYSEVSKYFESLEVKSSGSDNVLVAKISSSVLKDKLSEIDNLDTTKLTAEDLSSIPDFDIIITTKIDSKTNYPKSMVFDFDIDTIEYQGISLKLKKCSMNLNYDSYNNVEITIPDDVKAVKDVQ